MDAFNFSEMLLVEKFRVFLFNLVTLQLVFELVFRSLVCNKKKNLKRVLLFFVLKNRASFYIMKKIS